MATIDVVNLENKKAGSVDLSSAIFESEVKPHLYHAEVRRQLAERRSGTHSTKNRALVSGGGAKPYRQKGTGRARQGTTRAPQFQGGGVVFGPVPRGYSHKLPKKVRAAALRSALSERVAASKITIVDELAVDGYKTKRMAEILSTLGLADATTLIVVEDANPTVEASARNLPGVSVVRSEGVNVYDLLRHQNLLITKSAVEKLERPIVTEKSAIAREEANIATFRVDPAATKHEIRRAVEELFEVKVQSVRTMNQPGKKKRVGKKIGRKPSWKKAIVELAEGHTIEYFEGV